jgi:hypothetical protein
MAQPVPKDDVTQIRASAGVTGSFEFLVVAKK